MFFRNWLLILVQLFPKVAAHWKHHVKFNTRVKAEHFHTGKRTGSTSHWSEHHLDLKSLTGNAHSPSLQPYNRWRFPFAHADMLKWRYCASFFSLRVCDRYSILWNVLLIDNITVIFLHLQNVLKNEPKCVYFSPYSYSLLCALLLYCCYYSNISYAATSNTSILLPLWLLCFPATIQLSCDPARITAYIGASLYSAVNTTQSLFCWVKSTGAVGNLTAPVRFWWIQKVALVQSPEKDCLWKSKTSSLMTPECTGLGLTKYMQTSWPVWN